MSAPDPVAPTPPKHTPTEPTAALDVVRLCRSFLLVGSVGLAGALLYATATTTTVAAATGVFGAAVLIASAHALLGGLIGFLFAIPRSRQLDGTPSTTAMPAALPPRSDYATNTNLEQISDWLTKILVGASLVQLGAIKTEIASLATVFAAALGVGQSARAIALSIMALAVCWGFFFSYLLTRLWLPRALSRAEHDEAVQKRAVERENALNEVEQRVYKFLYEAPPGGFARAIQAAESYLGQAGATPSGWLYTYLASAYGQKHAYERLEQGSEEDTLVRNRVRTAVEQAVTLTPATKAVLVRLYQGEDPQENDLVTLRPDESLDALLLPGDTQPPERPIRPVVQP